MSTQHGMTTSTSWWIYCARERFTERAEREFAALSPSDARIKMARTVPDSINGQWIKGYRGDI